MSTFRIGVIYPSDGTLDREFWQFAPPEATIHVTRVRFPEAPATLELVQGLVDDEDLDLAAEALRPIRPAAVAYACTSISFARGLSGDNSIKQKIEKGADSRATTTSSAIVAACNALGVKRIAIGAPYPAEITSQFQKYLAESGLEPMSSRSLGVAQAVGRIETDRIFKLAQQADTSEAEAVVLACTDLNTYSIISDLEQALGKPVITANQATIWHACRIAGYDGTDGAGRLARAPLRNLVTKE
ncbi:aspartate/glutamate racemase family protein [Ensifer sp. BR816]|uniref:maleate cis-trans isomerase family protein n=1 Tax=Rhizobium sp. (strain BR816) TaxID=1057002 RepID=UPI0003761C0D|nr:aspartate/glutamate racemase family protein [Ensifer sp. BR816]